MENFWTNVLNGFAGLGGMLAGAFILWTAKELMDMRIKVSNLASKPVVDPVEYAKTMANVTSALTNLKESHDNRHREMKSELDEIKDLIKSK